MERKFYPAGGNRREVYKLMLGLGFQESNWSDKFWKNAYGVEVSIYGAGSMARISIGGKHVGDCPLNLLEERLRQLTTAAPAN